MPATRKPDHAHIRAFHAFRLAYRFQGKPFWYTNSVGYLTSITIWSEAGKLTGREVWHDESGVYITCTLPTWIVKRNCSERAYWEGQARLGEAAAKEREGEEPAPAPCGFTLDMFTEEDGRLLDCLPGEIAV